MSKYFSPNTLEHIKTTDPAPWMGVASTEAPEYDSVTQGCFYRDEQWVVEDVVLDTTQQLAEAHHYLDSTDFYYARFLETGEAVPEDVVTKRKEARDFIRANTPE